jgi:hypothetical protein
LTFIEVYGKNRLNNMQSVVSGKVFAMKQAVEICLNRGCPLANHFMEFTSFFPLPGLVQGERFKVQEKGLVASV